MFAKRCFVTLATAAMFLCTTAPAAAQAAPAPDDKGLLPMIPAEAFFFVEHRGHTAVHDAFLQSTLGKMYADEAIAQFVQDSRVQIGKIIMKQIFESAAVKTDPSELQQTLHKVTRQFWYRPAAMFLVLKDGKVEGEPGLGLICDMDQKARAEAKPALDSLMQIDVPSAGSGARQAFKWKTGTMEWNGVAMSHKQWQADPTGASGGKEVRKEWTIPSDPKQIVEELKDKTIFMTCWTDKHLLVASSLYAAETLGGTLAKPGVNKGKNESFARTMKKAAMKDWAFRWFIDVDLLSGAAKAEDSRGALDKVLKQLGLPAVHGMGGTGGYMDNVYARLTYVDAPKSGGGVLGIFRNGGDYAPALAMTPRSVTFVLAGQLDRTRTVALLRNTLLAIAVVEQTRRAAVPPNVMPPNIVPPGPIEVPQQVPGAPPVTQAPPAGGAPAAATEKQEPKLTEEQEKVVAGLDKLIAAGDGHVTVFMTDVQAMAGMMMGGGIPVAVVVKIKDQAKAGAAIEELVKASGLPEGAPPTPPAMPGQGAGAPMELPKEYRKIKIRYLGSMARIALLEDRAVLALGSDPFKAAIDTALDKMASPNPTRNRPSCSNCAARARRPSRSTWRRWPSWPGRC